MPSVEERFWAKVRKTSGCWLWIGAIKDTGYGAFRVSNRTVRPHRFAWTELYHRPVPAGTELRHTCDVRHCVREDHLTTGTRADNMRDMVERGRGNWITKPETVLRGEENGNSRLLARDVTEIRRRHAAGERQSTLATAFRVTQATISLILRRETWRHIS